MGFFGGIFSHRILQLSPSSTLQRFHHPQKRPRTLQLPPHPTPRQPEASPNLLHLYGFAPFGYFIQRVVFRVWLFFFFFHLAQHV